MAETKPSAGALRAARAIHELSPEGAWHDSVQRGEGSLSAREISGVANIIDRETGVAELLEAAKAVYDFLWKERGQIVGMTDIKLSEALQQAIAKCEGSE